MIHLPGEIISNIVSTLEPMDCNECFQVSRQWRHVIPRYASQPFRNTTVNDDSLRALACINVVGRFVITARLKFEQMATMIKVMDRLKSCSLLQKLELCNVDIMDAEVIHSKLTACFEKWRLETFAFVNISALTVNLVDYIELASNYNISHLAITCRNPGSYFHVQRPLLEYTNLNTLVSLVIDKPAGIRPSDIKALLSFAHNIEYLELSICYKDDTFISAIFTLCPKIIHFHLSLYSLTRLDTYIHPSDYFQLPAKTVSYDHGYPGLRCYWNSLTDFNQAECDMLLRHQSTLEILCIGCDDPLSHCTPDWERFNTSFLPNTTLKHLVLPLHRRQTDHHLPYEDGYADWLNACQALEHLELLKIGHAFGESMMHTLEYRLPSLRRIDLAFGVSDGTVDLYQNHLQLIRALRDRCNHTATLKELQLYIVGPYYDLHIATILSNVSTIRTLEELTVVCYKQPDDIDIFEFINNLQYSLPHLTTLRLEHTLITSDYVIQALGTLYRLDTLAFMFNEYTMSKNEAELLITTMGNILKKLYFIHYVLTCDAKTRIRSLAQNYPVQCIVVDD
ncbi:hypothetical protein K492DRAFT_199567 [Lichtheimia hyalospora FSU 10163]|nr:hypothetical protein K492DRAFT_199567 [Lichtheimia hyalospora FSU 10163]